MKAIINIFCSGNYGKNGEYLVELKKIEYFKNGNINKAKTLNNGYDLIKVLKQPYGFGKKIENIKEFLK